MKRLVALFVVGLGFVASNCSLNTEGAGLFEETGGNADASVGGAGGAAAQGGSAGKGGTAGHGGSSTGGANQGGNSPGGASGQDGGSGSAGEGGTGEGGTGDGGSSGQGGSGEGGSAGEGGTGDGGSTGQGGSGEGGSAGEGGSTGQGGSGEGGSAGQGGTGDGGSTGQGGSGEGGAVGVDASVCNLAALPAPTVYPLDSYVTNVRINGGGATANDIAPGSQLTVLYDFQIKNSNPCYCPGCWQQIYVGFAGVATTSCSNQSRGCPGNSGTNVSVTLTAPAQPGTYYLSVAATWDFNCISSTPETNAGAYVGAICVK